MISCKCLGQLVNLAANSEYAEILANMKKLESEYQEGNRDMGLEDLGKRTPQKGLKAQKVRAEIKAHKPELWKRLEAGELMETEKREAKARGTKKDKGK